MDYYFFEVYQMVEISPEVARVIVDFVLMLGSGIVGSYVTYVYAIKRTLQERLLTERVALYEPLVHALLSLADMSPADVRDAEKIKELENKLNRLSRELLLYAPDHLYKAFMKTMATVKKGAKVKPVIEFIVALRKELIGKTDITSEDVVEIRLRP